MKIAAMGLVAVLALSGTAALARGVASGHRTDGPDRPATSGFTAGSTGAALGNDAGSIAAGANSLQNPSGNSFFTTSPSGSTLTPQF
jgi:hydrogenase/urease accessory protein HupE